jgi:hypothetical protein
VDEGELISMITPLPPLARCSLLPENMTIWANFFFFAVSPLILETGKDPAVLLLVTFSLQRVSFILKKSSTLAPSVSEALEFSHPCIFSM